MFDHDGQKRVQKIFGVVSGGTDIEYCQKNDESFNVDVAEFASWIKEAGEGRLSSRQCGGSRAEAGADPPWQQQTTGTHQAQHCERHADISRRHER